MQRLSLLSFNIFGLPLLTHPRRLRTITRELGRSDVHLVCLQEVQTHGYLRTLLAHAGAYEHHAYDRRKAFSPKGGLLTMARLPLEGAVFIPYRAQGPWWSPERYLHKGMLVVQLRHSGRMVVVINTHLNLNPYGTWHTPNQVAHIALEQLRQLAEVVQCQPAEALVVVCGDFNFPRGCFLYEELIARSGLLDPLADDRRPTWRPPLDVRFLRRYAVPFDFMLLRHPPHWPGLRTEVDFCFDSKVPFEGGRSGYLSDHVGLRLRLQWDEAAPVC